MKFTPVVFVSGAVFTCLNDEGEDEPRSPACTANTLPTEPPRDGVSVFLHVEYYIVPGLGEVCCHWFLKDAFTFYLHTLKNHFHRKKQQLCATLLIFLLLKGLSLVFNKIDFFITTLLCQV